MTEFGRTVHENGAMGTDHGRGGIHARHGQHAQRRQVLRQHKGMADLDGGRFQPVHTDFRAVFAESLMKMFDFDPFKNDGFFPNWKPKSVDYLELPQAVKTA